MSWLWKNYNPDAVFETAGLLSSPREEMTEDKTGIRTVNPLLRFGDVFAPLYRESFDKGDLPLKAIENLFYHLLANLDRTRGVRALSLFRNEIKDAIVAGDYGAELADVFKLLSPIERDGIATLIYRQNQSGSRRLYYPEGLRLLFPGCLLYFNEDERRFAIVLPADETPQNKLKIRLLEYFFLDILANSPRYFWNRHFAIIGEESGRIDQRVMY